MSIKVNLYKMLIFKSLEDLSPILPLNFSHEPLFHFPLKFLSCPHNLLLISISSLCLISAANTFMNAHGSLRNTPVAILLKKLDSPSPRRIQLLVSLQLGLGPWALVLRIELA